MLVEVDYWLEAVRVRHGRFPQLSGRPSIRRKWTALASQEMSVMVSSRSAWTAVDRQALTHARTGRLVVAGPVAEVWVHVGLGA